MRPGQTLIAFAWLLVAGCALPDPGATRLIGHGGLGPEGAVPMNSHQSLLAALELGADGIEMDAQLTADSVLVAYHPEYLEELTDCSGHVNAYRWEELRACFQGASGDSYPIVRLDSALLTWAERFPKADFTLDCKLFAHGDWWDYLHAFTDAILRLDDVPSLKGRLLVDCKTSDFLHLLLVKRPGFPAFLYADSPAGAREQAQRLGCAGITLAYHRCNAEVVADAHAAGLQVTLFGSAGRSGHREALLQRPDRLQTDEPGYAVGLRRAAP